MFAWLTKLTEPDTRYRMAGILFMRLLAVVYLAAFFSTAREISGLVGEQGILPVGEYLAGLQQRFGQLAWLRFPTLFWLNHSDVMLLAISYAGCLFSMLLLFGWRPLLSTIVLFVLYVSLFRAGQVFFNFQWEYLLLEAGFLAIFLSRGPNRLLIFLFHWLLFRLRFFSGLAKWLSGDPTWASLTTLNYYFETQPLPHMGAWYAHQLPDWLLKCGTGLTLLVELVVPFFIFLPRPFRLFAAAATVLIQLLIILTSNHNFINLLTIALCLFLLDDQALRRFIPGWVRAHSTTLRQSSNVHRLLPLAAVMILATSVFSIYEFVADRRSQIGWDTPANWVRAWGLGNVFHVFPNMQTERHELQIEGSNDGRNWQAYRFRFKPNSAADRPAFIVPLHPRLDWMIWFIPPQPPFMRTWFERFLWRLHSNAAPVTDLLEYNPFPGQGPRYLRVMVYRYRFTSAVERRASGAIWHTELLGQFPNVPPRRP